MLSTTLQYHILSYLSDVFDLSNCLIAFRGDCVNSLPWKPSREGLSKLLEVLPKRLVRLKDPSAPEVCRSFTEWPRPIHPWHTLYLPTSTVDLCDEKVPSKVARVKTLSIQVGEDTLNRMVINWARTGKSTRDEVNDSSRVRGKYESAAWFRLLERVKFFIDRVVSYMSRTERRCSFRLKLTLVASSVCTRFTFPEFRDFLGKLSDHMESLVIVSQLTHIPKSFLDRQDTGNSLMRLLSMGPAPTVTTLGSREYSGDEAISPSKPSRPGTAPRAGDELQPDGHTLTLNYTSSPYLTSTTTMGGPDDKSQGAYLWNSKLSDWVPIQSMSLDSWKDIENRRILGCFQNLQVLQVLGPYSTLWLGALSETSFPAIREITIQPYSPVDLVSDVAGARSSKRSSLEDFFFNLGRLVTRVNLVLPDSDRTRQSLSNTVMSLTRALTALQSTDTGASGNKDFAPVTIAFIPSGVCGWEARRLLQEKYNFLDKADDTVVEHGGDYCPEDHARDRIVRDALLADIVRHVLRAAELMIWRTDVEATGGWTVRDAFTRDDGESTILFLPLDFIYIPEAVVQSGLGLRERNMAVTEGGGDRPGTAFPLEPVQEVDETPVEQADVALHQFGEVRHQIRKHAKEPRVLHDPWLSQMVDYVIGLR